MKHTTIIFILLATSMAVQAQNYKAVKLEFNYLQYPSVKLDPTWKYMPKVTQKNRQSILDKEKAYLDKLEKLNQQYQEDMKRYEGYKTVEKLVAGKPKKPNLPDTPPYGGEVLDEEAMANNYIKVDGFEKAYDNAEFIVEITLAGFEVMNKAEKDKEGKAFFYAINYTNPVSVRVYDNQGKEYLSKLIDASSQTTETAKKETKYELEKYWKANERTFLVELQKKSYDRALRIGAKYINDVLGYQQKSTKIKFYTGKAKKIAYPKLDQSIETIRRALVNFGDGTNRDALSKISEAVSIWKEVLLEKDMDNKKARINSKIASGIWWNCVQAYAILNDFENAKNYMTELKLNGRGVSKESAESFLEDFMARKRPE